MSVITDVMTISHHAPSRTAKNHPVAEESVDPYAPLKSSLKMLIVIMKCLLSPSATVCLYGTKQLESYASLFDRTGTEA